MTPPKQTRKPVETVKAPSLEPPSEAYQVVREGTGVEDTFALFERGSYEVNPAAIKRVLDEAGKYSRPVTVVIHGYASEEGTDEHNLNLSAHRAVTIKRALEPHLPEGSKVTILAYGETDAFGKRSQNRRVGIDFTEGAREEPRETEKTPEPGEEEYAKVEPENPVEFPTPYRLKLNPRFYLTPPTPPNVFQFQPPSLPPSYVPVLDYDAMVTPFRAHGIVPGDNAAFEENFNRAIQTSLALGIPLNIAETLANLGLPLMYNDMLSREAPNLQDRFQREFDVTLPPGQTATPYVIPIFSSDVLNFFFGNEKNKYPYRFNYP